MPRALLSCVSLLVSCVGVAAEARIEFNRDIRPILSDRCFYCHGPDENHRQADLRLDDSEAAYSGAIVPGSADDSELIARITSGDPDTRMPPPDSSKSLTANETDLLRRWINEGARYDSHWSFTPPRRRETPKIDSSWPRNEIDHFILKRLNEVGLAPSPSAGKEKLIRRVTLDLTGLPPSPQAVRAFLTDDAPGAYERVVDRLLKSEAYGERMAAVWLDAARYADTMGYQADWERFQWRWRGWVIDAYNRNLPFDDFTVEQLAGDLLPDPSVEQLIATGFNRNHRINDEGGIIPEEYLVEYIVDRVETTSATWLGLTMGCARCHDHKFDPFSQKDFYRLFAFFNGVPEKGKEGRKGYADPYMRVAVRGMEQQYDAVKQRLADAESEFQRVTDSLAKERSDWVASMRKKITSADDAWKVVQPDSVTARGVTFKKLRDASYLTTKVRNPNAEYVIDLPIDEEKPLRAIRLQTLTHPSLSGGKLSVGQGNFYLTDFSAEWIASGKKPTKVAIQSARADYEQNGHPVANAIDGDPKSSWAVDGHANKRNRVAVFSFAQPLRPATDSTIRLRLRFDSPHEKRMIGRFRLAVSTSTDAGLGPSIDLPGSVADVLKVTPNKWNPDQQKIVTEFHATTVDRARDTKRLLDTARRDLNEFEGSSTTYVMVMREMEQPRETHVLSRGLYDQPTEKVTRGVPNTVLGQLPDSAPRNRLGLARWLVSGEHPLTARVIVNRYWAMLFGRGIVSTLEDFGLQGEYPSHPELLDWLATEYPRIDWDTKALLKQMVMSATYRQDSDLTDELQRRDPENRLLARMSRVRLPAEVIRDSALASSGLLVRTIGGPSVKPYQPDGLWSDLSFNDKSRSTDFYVPSQGSGLYRRSLYTFWKRSVPPPTMSIFDAPSRETCVLQRSRTNTPLQALALMNDKTYVESSRVLAAQILSRQTADSAAWVDEAFLAILSRPPDRIERNVLLDGLRRRQAYYSEHPDDARRLIQIGTTSVDPAINETDLAALTTCVMNVFNMDEFINRE